MDNLDFTILIQGKLNRISVDNIPTYMQYGNVIVSCYNDDYDIDHENFEIVRSKDDAYNFFNTENIYRQSLTTLAGLKKTKTTHTIKVRSDEKYTNLQPIIDKINDNPNKFITNNIWFTDIETEPFHPSDHLICAKTESLIKTFSLVILLCEQYKGFPECHLPGSLFNLFWLNHISVETMIFLSFIYSHEYHLNLPTKNKEDIRQIMNKYCDLVDIEDLGPYIFTQQGVHYTTNIKLIDSKCLNSINEL